MSPEGGYFGEGEDYRMLSKTRSEGISRQFEQRPDY